MRLYLVNAIVRPEFARVSPSIRPRVSIGPVIFRTELALSMRIKDVISLSPVNDAPVIQQADNLPRHGGGSEETNRSSDYR